MEAEHDAGLEQEQERRVDGSTTHDSADGVNEADGPAAAEVVRSEEVLNVSLDTQATERVALRKHVITETVTQVVERRREELIIERQPVDPANEPADTAPGTPAGPGFVDVFTDTDYEIVLYEERVVVTKEVVPVERIRLQKRAVTDVMQVQDELRREHVETTQAKVDDPG